MGNKSVWNNAVFLGMLFLRAATSRTGFAQARGRSSLLEQLGATLGSSAPDGWKHSVIQGGHTKRSEGPRGHHGDIEGYTYAFGK